MICLGLFTHSVGGTHSDGCLVIGWGGGVPADETCVCLRTFGSFVSGAWHVSLEWVLISAS